MAIIKKKIKDLTKEEVNKICDEMAVHNCTSCPISIFINGDYYCSLRLKEKAEEKLNKKIEVPK